MSQALMIAGPREAELVEYDETDPGQNQVLIESEFSDFKHGTGLRQYRADSRDYTAAFDWERGLHREGETHLPDYPQPIGNITVGTVRAVGDEVERFTEGDRVYGYLPIRETHTVTANDIDPVPVGMPAETVVYADPARVGLYLVRTGHVRVGDTVLVVGAGAIGQMAAQLARLQGARWVAVSDPIARRRVAAREHVDRVIDPTEEDVAEIVRAAIQHHPVEGVDVSLETSGAYPGLSDAIRATAYGGIVASCGYYDGDGADLHLAGEWHRNALELRSVRPPSRPNRDAPRWNLDRLNQTAFNLLRDEKLSASGLIDPIVDFADAPEGLALIDEHPEETIKLGIRY